MPVNVSRKGITDQSPTTPERYNAETERLKALVAAVDMAAGSVRLTAEGKAVYALPNHKAVIKAGMAQIADLLGVKAGA